MKKSLIKHLSLVLLICMLFSVLGTSCFEETEVNVDNGLDDTDTSGNVDNGGIQGTYKPPVGEYDIETPEGYNKVTFYWRWPGKTWNEYKECDIWIWYDDVDGKGYTFTECAYGVKVVINVPDTVTEVGFIVRRNCSEPGGSSWGTAVKDGDNDRFAIITGKETYIFLENGDTNQYASDDGVKLVQIKKFNVAGMDDFHTITYNITPAKRLENYQQVSVWDGDKKLTVLRVNMMGTNASSGKITVEEKLELNKIYTVKIEGFEPINVVPMGIFDSKEFGEMYNYEGTDLGSYINGENTTFKVWAPTAVKVVLDLYTKGNEVDENGDPIPGSAKDAYDRIEMTLGEKGVWTANVKDAGHGTYYTYTVTTAAGTETATDPYGKAAGLNGNRTMVVDLDKTNPEGWTDLDFDPSFDGKVDFDSYSDAFIWEVHIRDFSNLIKSSEYKGKYLAFTERGLVNEYGQPVGVDYLVNLGVTHVHLLPSYDYATVKEEDPNSGFNWGYDPKNYNVPEGSYSTNPYDGEVRINEYKQMVQALHDAGIGVIMDVVYNHTFSATDSNFHRIVPYYYYRYNANGTNMNASGCGNDTASERYMFGKFMVESVTYWLTEYNLDGFRFDLMGLHDLDTMIAIEKAVHELNPNAILYGEGWTMGSTIGNVPQANQSNIINVPTTNNAIGSIAVFNDNMRNGLKGNSGFGTITSGIINGSANSENMNKVLFSIMGGMVSGQSWRVNDSMVINYMSAHDNLALWDQLTLTMGGSEAAKAKANRLGAAILFVSKGTPFVQAGEEFLRTKPYYDKQGELVPGEYDENSYNSCDETNNLKWNTLVEGSEAYKMVEYYKGLVAMRKANPIFSDVDTRITKVADLGSAGYVLHYELGNQEAYVLVNASSSPVSYNLSGSWKLIATVDESNINRTHNGGNTNVPAGGILVYVK